MILVGVTLFAVILGAFLPTRYGLVSYGIGVGVLFLAQVVANIALGFEGIPFSDILLVFEDSYLSYAGYNVGVAFRGFALPLLVFSMVFVFRLTRTTP